MNVRFFLKNWGSIFFNCFFRATNLVLIWYMSCGVLFCHCLLNILLVGTYKVKQEFAVHTI